MSDGTTFTSDDLADDYERTHFGDEDQTCGTCALEAELAALKARRCETCDDGDAVMGTEDEPRVYCGWHSSWWPSNAYCSQWSKREDTP